MAKNARTKKPAKRQGRAWHIAAPEFLLLPALSLTTLRSRRKHRWTLALSVLVGLELLAGASLFAWRQPVRQVNLAGLYTSRTLNSQRVAAELKEAEETYRLLVRYPDKSMRAFSLKDMGMSIDAPETLAAARSAQHGGNVFQHVEWWRVTFVPIALQIDETRFAEFLNSHVTFAATQPQDAQLKIENGEIKEVAGVDGQRYDLPDSAQHVKLAAQGMDRTPLTPSGKKVPPAITQVQLAEPRKKLEAILNQKVGFSIEGKQTSVSRAVIGTWIDLVPVPAQRTIDVTVNGGKVQGYLNQLAASYIHSPRTQIMESGGTILVAGQNGADIRGRETLAATATAQLLRAEGVNLDLPVTYTPHRTITATPYPKWIEVDLTTKRLYAYETTSQVREALISAGAPATPTVTGQFAIYAKYRSQTMSGPNADGSRYTQPNVPYVNYFFHDYAIHGNYWRPASYFGRINSSHGCVGIRDPDSAWIYSWAPIGTPVIVHT